MENELVILVDGLICIHLSQGNVSLEVSDIKGIKDSASANSPLRERNHKELGLPCDEQSLQLLVRRPEVLVKVNRKL